MFRGYAKRLLFCILSLALFGLGNFFSVKAGAAGTNAWNTLSLGLSNLFRFSFGTSTLLISLLIILIDLLGKGKLGLGTFLNVLLIPFFSDLYLNLFTFIPTASTAFSGVVCTLLGQVIISFATILYMTPALGCGPRDTLMIILGKFCPRLPIGMVRFCMDMCVLLIGFLMGAPLGLGTVLVLLLQASIFQLACKLTHYEPRAVDHESFVDTWRNLFTNKQT